MADHFAEDRAAIDSREFSFYCSGQHCLAAHQLDEAGRTTDEEAALGAVSASSTGGVAVAFQTNLYRCDH